MGDLTKDFSRSEVACKCGCGMLPQASSLERLQKLRDVVGFPLRISSGARCAKHNMEVSDTGAGGPHTTGQAFDILVDHDKAWLVMRAAVNLGFTGIGVSQKGPSRFLHVDDLQQAGRPTVWSY